MTKDTIRKYIQETLFLLSVPGMRESIKTGLAEPVDACAEQPER